MNRIDQHTRLVRGYSKDKLPAWVWKKLFELQRAEHAIPLLVVEERDAAEPVVVLALEDWQELSRLIQWPEDDMEGSESA